MISIKKVLVPTDFSEHSDKAVRYGADLAAKFGGELHLLHVFETTPIMYGEGAGIPESAAEMKAAAVEKLDGVQVDALEECPVVRKVMQGNAFVETVRYAKDNTIDLLVMGTHGRGAIAHMLLGSVAEQVVRKAPCPVLIVRDEQHHFVLP